MTTPYRALTLGSFALGLIVATSAGVRAPARVLPDRLTDAEFWALVTDISEPGGYFRLADNFTSNEMQIGEVVGQLRDRRVTGGAYIGVGPEQNLTYIAAIRPAVAFVIDLRRQAVIQHLMFKAVFELARDRADFISLLFSKPRPLQLDSTTSIQAMWDAFRLVATDSALATRNFQRISDQLVRVHQFPLSEEERGTLRYVWDAFTQHGPGISTSVNQGGRGGGRGTFVTLTAASADSTGAPQSFLVAEDNYRFVRSLHERNMIVPVSGDFSGPKALRAIGEWLKKQNTTVTAFYVSNVEQYLFQDRKQAAFYANTLTLPLSPSSVFIRPYAIRGVGGFGGGGSFLGPRRPLCPMQSFLSAWTPAREGAYNEALACAM